MALRLEGFTAAVATQAAAVAKATAAAVAPAAAVANPPHSGSTGPHRLPK